ncbi:anti-sigma factor family protein [Dinghuibacter silviterrae]|uniref:Uncharacterized protein n=1 Tax=Dinghuibacter silviterrae TaxID=1539049 RepID=A0A4R8DP54_9BACT|nr:hypothetical protein [Dinghuibacter silviterrae]TDW99608.1 hypothetical protein EDB95_0618 [Dinghuibacter silviterrae]
MRLMVTCEEATDWISRREEGKLTLSRGLRLRLHLFLCVFCRRFNRQNKILIHHVHHHNDATLSDQEKKAMADRLRGL